MLLLLSDNASLGIITTILISIAGLTDFLDGYLARYWKSETAIGQLLDPLADKTLVIAALIMFVGLGRVHPILVVILIGREIIITGLRAIASSKGTVIGANATAKYKTAFQMIAIGGLALHETYFGMNMHLVGLFFLYLSLGFSIYSAIEYVQFFLTHVFQIDEGR